MNVRNRLAVAIENEIALSNRLSHDRDYIAAFQHLERAHVLGQASTYQHTRIHWRILKLGFKMHSAREIWGQFIRIVGASTKTPLGIYPSGNTGGANVWFFKSTPVPSDLQQIIDHAQSKPE